MNREEAMEKIQPIINEVFGDTSRSQEETAEELVGLMADVQEEIGTLLSTLGD